MDELFGIPAPLLFGQLLLGLINGAFYAMLSIGLVVIFRTSNIINFAHGAHFMMGGFAAWMLLNWLGLGYWWALLLVPITIGIIGVIFERLFISRVYKLHEMYGVLLTLGLGLTIEGVFRNEFGSSGLRYRIPPELSGAWDLGFMFMPIYRAWVVVFALVACLTTWRVIENTRLGAYIRKPTENAALVQAYGVNVPRMVTLIYGAGVALAALGGVLAAPIYSVNPQMGSNLIIVVFAVVVIGGMGSVYGLIVTGFALGITEGLTKVFYPEASATVIFVIMAVVLLARPSVPLRRTGSTNNKASVTANPTGTGRHAHWPRGLGWSQLVAPALLLAAIVAAPPFPYSQAAKTLLCFVLLVYAFSLLIRHAGLLKLSHAVYFGIGGCVAGYAANVLGEALEISIVLGGAVGTAMWLVLGGLVVPVGPNGRQVHGLWGFSRAQLGALLIMVTFLAVAPFVLYPVFLMKLLCFALFALAFNLLSGYVGLLSFGHAAYFGMGGYITGHMAKAWGVTPELSILGGAVVAGLLGAVFGWLAIRRQRIYFALITLVLAQMVYFFCVQAPFTGGEDGIQAIPRGELFGLIPLEDDMAMYWVTAAIFVLGFLLINRFVHSAFGREPEIIGVEEALINPPRYRTDDYQLIAFVLSATVAGMAGATKSLVFGIATLTDVHWTMSAEVVLMTLVGGLGTVLGPVIGAAVIVTMQNYLAELGAWVTVIQGVIFAACVLAFRRGIIGEMANLLKVKL